MLFLDIARTTALAVLAFMIGDLIGDALAESRELWAMALGAFTLFSGTLVALYRDEQTSYSPPSVWEW